MTSEQETLLLEYLASAGFNGGQLTRELRDKIASQASSFKLSHRVDYGDQQMRYDLHFKRDHLFSTYSLDYYKAIHRNPVIIEHKMVGGLDTEKLEKKIAAENWTGFFNNEITDATSIVSMTELLNQLSRLSNLEGTGIQEQLMFKYLPQALEPSVLRLYQSHYERHREFNAGENGITHANLAYFILSGMFDDLYEKLDFMKLDGYPGVELNWKLEEELSRNSQQFEIKASHNSPEGYMELTVPVTRSETEFLLETFRMTVTPYPEIKHDLYMGIDSQKLEDAMKKIDWHDDRQLFYFEEDNPELLPDIEEIKVQIHRLSKDPAGMDIAQQLQLKYWVDASFFDGLIEQTVWDRLESLPKKAEKFPCYMEAFVAYNLLCGRAVQEQFVLPVSEAQDRWVRINQDRGTGNFYVHIEKFANEELESSLRLLPLPGREFYPTLNSLKRGGMPLATLNNHRQVLLEANPEHATINFYTPAGKAIPANIHFDPDWEPATLKQEQLVLERQAPTPPKHKNFRRNRSKGRGI